jgi:hypothetical protein
MRVADISAKSVAIVYFGVFDRNVDGTWPHGLGVNPGQFFQVTIDPQMCSASGEFIRFGNSPGDELHGWQLATNLVVAEVLGEWDGEQPPVMSYGISKGITEKA